MEYLGLRLEKFQNVAEHRKRVEQINTKPLAWIYETK